MRSSRNHPQRQRFADREAVIRRIENGTFPGGLPPQELGGFEIEMAGVLLPGIDVDSCKRCLEIAQKSPLLYTAVALHPNHTVEATEGDWNTVCVLARRADVAAIGETGLDRFRNDSPFETQLDLFRRHIDLSKATGKPILVHNRDAWEDMLPILRGETNLCTKSGGVIHAFSGNADQAKECVDLGWHVSFAGPVTYRNAKFAALWEAAKAVPLDRLLIETDSPFLIPHPFRGKLPRNEPTMAALVARRLAELRKEPLEKIAQATAENARRVFGLKRGY